MGTEANIGPWSLNQHYTNERLNELINRINEFLRGRRLLKVVCNSADNDLLSPSYDSLSQPAHRVIRFGSPYLEIPAHLWIDIPIKPLVLNNVSYMSEIAIVGDSLVIKYPFTRSFESQEPSWVHVSLTRLGPSSK